MPHVLECHGQRIASCPYGRDGRISSVLGGEAGLFCRVPCALRGFALLLLAEPELFDDPTRIVFVMKCGEIVKNLLS